jgi:hypothetical protein
MKLFTESKEVQGEIRAACRPRTTMVRGLRQTGKFQNIFGILGLDLI